MKKFFSKIDAKFCIYMISSLMIYGLVWACWFFQVFGIISFNALMDFNIIVGSAYMGVNIFDKWITNPDEISTAEFDGVSRKNLVWYNSAIFFVLMCVIAIYLDKKDGTLDPTKLEMGKLVSTFTFLTAIFLTAKAADKPLAKMDSPIKPKVVKEDDAEDTTSEADK